MYSCANWNEERVKAAIGWHAKRNDYGQNWRKSLLSACALYDLGHLATEGGGKRGRHLPDLQRCCLRLGQR